MLNASRAERKAFLPSCMKAVYILSSAAILLFTGSVKLIASFQQTSFLAATDPLFQFLTHRQMSVLVGVFELLVVAMLIFNPSTTARLWTILWTGIIFVSYRTGLAMVDYHGPCSCIGGAVVWFTRNQEAVEWAMKAVLAYLLVPSCAFLAIPLFRAGRKNPPAAVNAGPMMS